MKKPSNATKKEISFRINDEIPRFYHSVRLISDDGANEVVSLYEARKRADEQGLDLIEINSRATPPILKIANYEKMVYAMKKNAKKNKTQVAQLKEVQLSVNIAEHDLQTKLDQAKRFLEHGDKVRAVLSMRGRELSRREESQKSILEFAVALSEIAVIESRRDEGNKTIYIFRHK